MNESLEDEGGAALHDEKWKGRCEKLQHLYETACVSNASLMCAIKSKEADIAYLKAAVDVHKGMNVRFCNILETTQADLVRVKADLECAKNEADRCKGKNQRLKAERREFQIRTLELETLRLKEDNVGLKKENEILKGKRAEFQNSGLILENEGLKEENENLKKEREDLQNEIRRLNAEKELKMREGMDQQMQAVAAANANVIADLKKMKEKIKETVSAHEKEAAARETVLRRELETLKENLRNSHMERCQVEEEAAARETILRRELQVLNEKLGNSQAERLQALEKVEKMTETLAMHDKEAAENETILRRQLQVLNENLRALEKAREMWNEYKLVLEENLQKEKAKAKDLEDRFTKVAEMMDGGD